VDLESEIEFVGGDGLRGEEFKRGDLVRFFETVARGGDEEAAVFNQRCVGTGEFDKQEGGVQRAGRLKRALLNCELTKALLRHGFLPGAESLQFTIRQLRELKDGGLLQMPGCTGETGGGGHAGGIDQGDFPDWSRIVRMQAPAPGDGEQGVGTDEQENLARTE
jgi:hypothetical protein